MTLSCPGYEPDAADQTPQHGPHCGCRPALQMADGYPLCEQCGRHYAIHRRGAEQ
jgi:hypothetical protein